MQVVEMSLLNLSLLDFMFPADMKSRTITNDEVMWDYNFKMRFNSQPPPDKMVTLTMFYKLFYKNDTLKKTIAKVEVENIYLVKGQLSPEAKQQMILMMLPMLSSNIQGIYAAKTEGSALALMLPPLVDFYKHNERIKKVINNEWT